MIKNQTKNSIIASQHLVADTFLSRMIGLLNRTKLHDHEALVITRCQQIHMFFMRFSIDAIFVNKSNMVVGVVRNIKPFQISNIYFGAAFVIETPVGVIEQSNTEKGDRIIFT